MGGRRGDLLPGRPAFHAGCIGEMLPQSATEIHRFAYVEELVIITIEKIYTRSLGGGPYCAARSIEGTVY